MDEKSNLDCDICFEAYSVQNERQPMILVGCGHTICRNCLDNLPQRNCPQCRIPIYNNSVPNRLVLNLLESNLNNNSSKFANENVLMKNALLEVANDRNDLRIANEQLIRQTDALKYQLDNSKKFHSRGLGPINVFIKNIRGKTLYFKGKPESKVSELMEFICHEWNYNVQYLRYLIHVPAGKKLSDTECLSDFVPDNNEDVIIHAVFWY